MKPLTVYKASAGSGKTFTLAIEYIKLLIADPYSYSSILAVTFTNKATEEMKQRILSQLYGIANNLPDSSSYAGKVMADLGMGQRQVMERAATALHLLTHNYSYFRVQTIDTFFQSVMRNLARELDLTPNLRIELNDAQVEDLAVDELIEGLDAGSLILHWLKEYVMENISEDKSWNVISGIKRFGQNIFSDTYKEHRDRLNEVLAKPEDFEKYRQTIRKLRTQAIECMRGVGETFLDTLSGYGLDVSMFSNGAAGVCGYFLKLQRGDFGDDIVGKRVLDAMESSDKWVAKSKPKAERLRLISIVDDELLPQLLEGEKLRQQFAPQYRSADITLRHLNQLRLLKAIDEKVREMNANENRFLLSDTQNLLHGLVKGSADSPFIYEKIGSRLEHIMIDEFQDTSTVQWKNFKVLLDECLSHSTHGSLIVGDVKQSIYRWRSGDWQLLNNIESQFSSPETQLEVRSLTTNYRSGRSVVTFNNSFFNKAKQIETQAQKDDDNTEADEISKAYDDVTQALPDGERPNGLVRVSLLPDTDYDDTMMDAIKTTVEELLQQGISQDKIAILVRNNKHIANIANYLTQAGTGITVISDEAFRLDASLAVNLIVEAMRVLAHPDDQLARANLVKMWHEVEGDGLADTDLFATDAAADSFLPSLFVSQTERLRSLPVSDMVDEVYRIFGLSRLTGQSAYVCTFCDLLNKYLTDNVADIGSFVSEWDEALHKKTIQSDAACGVRILSIHKSKGLEFDNVILPYCSWPLEQEGDTIWCFPDVAPYNELPLVPIEYRANQMRGTVYDKDYKHEHLQNMVDNLNLLYVAFTRAGHNLFVIGKRDATKTRSDLIQQALPQVAKELGVDDFAVSEDKNEAVLFEYGSLHVPGQKARKKTANVFLSEAEPYPLRIESFANKVEFRQSNKSREFVEEDEEVISRRGYIRLGNVLHNIFSTIHTSADIPHTLAAMEEDGVLYDEEVRPEEVRRLIERGLSHPTVAEWFSPKWRLYNECSILSVEDGQTVERRPDRVMSDGQTTKVVDFKFGSPRPEHATQVGQYMNLLRSMGHEHVEGYLWYVRQNKVVECDGK